MHGFRCNSLLGQSVAVRTDPSAHLGRLLLQLQLLLANDLLGRSFGIRCRQGSILHEVTHQATPHGCSPTRVTWCSMQRGSSVAACSWVILRCQ